MAIIKSAEKKIKTKESVLRVLKYTTNPNKASFVSAENCYGNANDIFLQFEEVRSLQEKKQKNGILTHHYIQSFSPDDNITAEQAHKIAIELMKKSAPNYQYVISTHVDKEHIHNHIVINSVNPVTCYKWHDNMNTVNHMREISDELCQEYNLSTIDKSETRGIDQTTYQLGIKGVSWKINLVKDLDEAILQCQSKIDFIDFLNKRDYSVRYKDAHITITKNGEKKGIRVDTLAKQFGEKYKKDNLEKAMGYHSAKKNIKSIVEEKHVSIKKEKSETISEWQRYEFWYFKEDVKKTKNFKNVSSLPKSITATSRIEIFLLRLIFYILLKKHMKNKYRVYSTQKKKYIINRLCSQKKPYLEKKPSANVKAVGNISRKELLNVDGKNIFINIDTIQLLKLSEADFFYSARINVKDRMSQVVVKEENIKKLSELIDIPILKIQKDNRDIANRIIYNELKKTAEMNSEKLEFRVTDEAGAEKLKNKNVKVACFIKDDGKYNVAFLMKDVDFVNEVLSSDSVRGSKESERGKNLRLNNEIKKAAALSGEKPLYRVIDSSELDKLRQTDIRFAVFENKEKFNIVFLKEDAENVKNALNELSAIKLGGK